jgi:hypothetical protein
MDQLIHFHEALLYSAMVLTSVTLVAVGLMMTGDTDS